MDNIVVAFANEEAQRRIVRLLESGGVSPAGCFFSGADAIRTIRQLGGGIVVCSFKLRDMTAVDLAASLRDLGSLLVVSSAANLEFCEGENLFKLATPAARSDFFASLDLLRKLEAHPHPRPHRAEEEQRVIRRAKELLMDINRMTEAEAHRFLQKRSMDTGTRLAETAQHIIDRYTY